MGERRVEKEETRRRGKGKEPVQHCEMRLRVSGGTFTVGGTTSLSMRSSAAVEEDEG